MGTVGLPQACSGVTILALALLAEGQCAYHCWCFTFTKWTTDKQLRGIRVWKLLSPDGSDKDGPEDLPGERIGCKLVVPSKRERAQWRQERRVPRRSLLPFPGVLILWEAQIPLPGPCPLQSTPPSKPTISKLGSRRAWTCQPQLSLWSICYFYGSLSASLEY